MALCTNDDNQRSSVRSFVHSFVRKHIERRAAERISHSVRCEPQPHRGPIFFFLVDFVCGRARLSAPKRHNVSFLFFPSMTTKPFSSSFFLFLRLAFLFLSRAFFSPLSVKHHILFLASVEFYDPPCYIYALSKWEYSHSWKRVPRPPAMVYINYRFIFTI